MSSVDNQLPRTDTGEARRGLLLGMARVLLLALLGLSLCLCGCKNPQIVWSLESKSPDGKFVATAQAFANGGFGVSGIPATFVYLNWAVGSQKPKEILEFANESDTPQGEAVEIKWLAPTQLQVAYRKDSQELQFQTVKFGDVNITVIDMSKSSP